LGTTFSAPAINADGSKMMTSCSPNNNVIVDFTTSNYSFAQTGGTPNWVGNSTDGSLFISGGFYHSVIDPANGTILDINTTRPVMTGTIGPNNQIAVSDPLRYESIAYYNFSQSSMSTDGTSSTGSDLEADASYVAKFTEDEETLLVVNPLSGTVSVIDVDNESLTGIIPLNTTDIYSIAITDDGNYALVGKRLLNQVDIIDLNINAVVATVSSGGVKPDQVFILPNQQEAYVLNAGSNDLLGIINIDGSNSSFGGTIDIGNTGVSWTNYGIRSQLAFSEDGNTALIANSFDDQIQVIDVNEHEVVQIIQATGFPLQIAMAPDNGLGEFAAVTLKNDDKILLLNKVNGQWSDLGTFACPENPTDISFDPFTYSFYVVSSDEASVERFDINEFAFFDAVSYNVNYPIRAGYTIGDRNFVLLHSDDDDIAPYRLQVNTTTSSDFYDLTSLPIRGMDFTADGDLVAIPHPRTDEVTLFKETTLVGFEQVNINLEKLSYDVFPNVVQDQFVVQEKLNTNRDAIFELIDINGKTIFSQKIQNKETMVQRNSNWSAGNYFYIISDKERVVQSGKIIFSK